MVDADALTDKHASVAGVEDGPNEKTQDPRVERLRPDPSRPPQRGRTLAGFWGNSDRDGFRRLYLANDLSAFAEFRVDDVLATFEIPPDQPPFLGEQATRVELREGADIVLTQVRQVTEVDEFDLDIRFGTRPERAFATAFASSGRLACVEPGEPITDPCNYTCDICLTAKGPGGRDCPGQGPGGTFGGFPRPTATCDTCRTNCGTCPTDPGATNCGTCYTEPGNTQCGTCYTEVGATECGGCARRR